MVRGLPYLSHGCRCATPVTLAGRTDSLSAGQVQNDFDGGSPSVARAPLD